MVFKISILDFQMDPKFLRNQRFCKKGNLKPAKQLARAAERKATREAKAKK